jgi:glucose/arabinose dehydrogenase
MPITNLRRVFAFLASVAVMVISGSFAHALFVQRAWSLAAAHAARATEAVSIPFGDRVHWAAHDLVGMASSYATLLAMALCIAFLGAGVVIRFTRRRVVMFTLAGGVAVFVMFTALWFFLGTSGVFGARGVTGLSTQVLIGLSSGVLFSQLTSTASPRRHMLARCTWIFIVVTVGLAIGAESTNPLRLAPSQQRAPAVTTGYRVHEIARGLDHPWSMAFLPDGSILVTERPGRLRLIKNGVLLSTPIPGVPRVHTGSQAGLFDVVLHPRFAENHWVYLTYADGSRGDNGTQVVRARFDGVALRDLRVIFRAQPRKGTDNHYGARMAFLPDSTFLLTIGEGFEYRERAQDLDSDLGKIVRLNDDGSIPRDNPFIGQANVRPEIYSWGHRNSQGLVFDAVSDRIYETEHGPHGGDELNVIAPRSNYGWPVITYGTDYSGAYVSPYARRAGLAQPLDQWTPSIAPSGLALYRGDRFPAWKGDLFVGALAFEHLRHVHLDEHGTIVEQQELLADRHWRVRDVRAPADGYLYVTTDDTDGRVLRLEPDTESSTR